MNKDLKATAILLGIIGFLFGTWWVGAYGSMMVKQIIVLSVISIMGFVLIIAIWKIIRIAID